MKIVADSNTMKIFFSAAISVPADCPLPKKKLFWLLSKPLL